MQHQSETPDSKRKAVVIGGCGFLGRRLVAMLSGGDASLTPSPEWPRFDHVHVFDRAPFVETDAERASRERGGVGLTSSTGDVRAKADLSAAITGAHTVFHLASLVDVGLKKNPTIDEINVGGTRNVVEVCQALGVPFLVYTSTEDVVFSETPVAGGDESLPYPTKPMHDYVRTKIEGERIVRGANGKAGLATCTVRPVHIYGPNDPHAMVESLVAFADGKVPVLLGDGSARFDVVYVDNVAHGHLLAASRLHDAKTRDVVGGKAYIVNEDHAPNYFEFLRPFAEARDIALPRRRLPTPLVYVAACGMELAHKITGKEVTFHRFHYYILAKDFFFSGANAARDLGYRPFVTKEEGLARTMAWVKTVPLR